LKNFRDSDVPALCLLSVLWVAAVLVVDPRGEYYRTDDWAFADSVQAMVQGRGFVLSDWAAMNLFSHVLWGAAFASVFGFSMTVLRFSTLVAGLIGGIATFRLFRLAGVNRAIALMGALLLLFNPLYFSLSFGFMTDVPYTAAQLVAMWLIAEGMMLQSTVRLGFGWLVAVAVLLCRQTGLVIPFAFIGEAITRRPWNVRDYVRTHWRRIALGVGAVAAFVVIQWAYMRWLRATDNVPLNFGYQVNTIAIALTQRTDLLFAWVLEFLSDSFFYLGLFLLPLTLACIPMWLALLPLRWRTAALVGVVLLGQIIFIAQSVGGDLFPMWWNSLNNYNGLGGEEYMKTPIPDWLRVVLTALASLGGVLLVCALAGSVFAWFRERPARGFDIPVFALGVAVATLTPVALITFRFDRYLVPPLPCIAIALSVLLARQIPSRGLLIGAFSAVFVMSAVTILAVHDLTEYKRVHFAAYQRLIQTVPPRFVNAQWIANMSENYEYMGRPRQVEGAFERACYLVSVTQTEGYTTIASLPVDRWMPGSQAGPPVRVQVKNERPNARPCIRDDDENGRRRRPVRVNG
jgi:hypothetical protein